MELAGAKSYAVGAESYAVGAESYAVGAKSYAVGAKSYAVGAKSYGKRIPARAPVSGALGDLSFGSCVRGRPGTGL